MQCWRRDDVVLTEGFAVLAKGLHRDSEGLRKSPFKNFVGIVERSGASKGVKTPPGRPIYNAICNAYPLHKLIVYRRCISSE